MRPSFVPGRCYSLRNTCTAFNPSSSPNLRLKLRLLLLNRMSAPFRAVRSTRVASRAWSSLTVVVSTLFSALPLTASEPEAKAHPLSGVQITELARREVWQDGRRLSFVRILPPQLPRRPAPPPPAIRELTPEQTALEERRTAKSQIQVSLFGGVYVGDATIPTGTELRLQRREGETLRQARVFIPHDLRHVDTLLDLETEDAVYHYTVLVSVCDLASLRPSEWPPEIAAYAASGGRSASDVKTEDAPEVPAYIFEGSPADAEVFDETLLGLELLLAHLSLHREALAATYAEREARNAERARLAALNPPRPRDETVYFWRIENPVAKP